MALGEQIGDRAGILGIGLERLIVRDVLPPLGVGGQDADDREAQLGEVMSEGEAVVPGELDADEDRLRRGARRLVAG